MKNPDELFTAFWQWSAANSHGLPVGTLPIINFEFFEERSFVGNILVFS